MFPRLGTDALTAVSLAYPLQNAIVSVGVGIGVGISSAISICLGRGDQEGADRSATIGVALTVFHCILFILLGIFVTKPFLSLFTDSPKVLSDACNYTYIVLCVSFGSLLQIAFEKIFQGIGQMKITMYLLSVGCIINIILDPILIFGLLGFPALGVAGAAIATVIGQIGAFLLYIVVYLRKPYAVRIHPKYLKFDKKIIRQIYSVGIPSSIMMLLPSVLISILNSILAAFSEVYVAVLGVYFKLQTFIYMPTNGIVQGMRPIIGYNYGAGEEKRVRTTIRYSLVCAAALMLTGTLLSLLIPGPIFSLFDADEALMSAGITALRIICLGFLVSTIGVIYSGTFEALGNGRNSLIISLLPIRISIHSLKFHPVPLFRGSRSLGVVSCRRTLRVHCSLLSPSALRRRENVSLLPAKIIGQGKRSFPGHCNTAPSKCLLVQARQPLAGLIPLPTGSLPPFFF